jgi:cytochrome o ubiquinol oxidase operon protein cyoD
MTEHESELLPEMLNVAPGQPHDSMLSETISYVLGLGFALILTGVSFWVASTSSLWGPGVAVGLVVLAIAQMGVHLVFFLHITSGPDNTNNVLALAFGVLIVFLVMVGTIWIMAHLAANMGPSQELMNLQVQH